MLDGPRRSSVKPDYIVCLEDGKRLKMLKRHLMTHYQMTPDQYRKTVEEDITFNYMRLQQRKLDKDTQKTTAK